MGMVGSRALDDRVRLSHTSLVSVLTGRDFRIGSISEVRPRDGDVRYRLGSRHHQAAPACPESANPGLPVSEIISPGADRGQGGDYAKAFVQILKTLSISYPNPNSTVIHS
jgi:hypothetical protein